MRQKKKRWWNFPAHKIDPGEKKKDKIERLA